MEDSSIYRRVQLLGLGLGFLAMAISTRLFYLQVIKHSHYTVLAGEGQLRKFEVHPDRGAVYMQDRGNKLPVVINRTLKRVYIDPRFIADPQQSAKDLAKILKGSVKEYESKMKEDSFYVVLADKITPAVAKKVSNLELAGVGVQDMPTRVYPEGNLAAQVLGFVNNEGQGQYGVEESYNQALSGQIGFLNATTDTRGIPIATSSNYRVPPRAGSDIVLTIDRNIQTKVEQILKSNAQKYSAPAASAVVLDPNNGSILAMANYPTFDPAKFSQVSDYNLFQNRVVSGLYEPGSVIKAFTMSAGLETGAVTPNSTYLDTGSVKVGDREIDNATGIATGIHTMKDVIIKSINTGVVHVLKQLGGGAINLTGKTRLHEFFVDKFGFSKLTGVDLPSEAGGVIFPPENSDVDYANMTFGQGMSATMLQVASGFGVLANGGTLYRPYVVDQVIDNRGQVTKTQPKAVAKDVISSDTIKKIKQMLGGVVEDTGDAVISGYSFGGKSGTAQIPNPAGGYFNNRDIGSFVGMAPLNKPAFVVMVRIDEPRIGTFASAAARPMAGEIMKWLLTYGGIKPNR